MLNLNDIDYRKVEQYKIFHKGSEACKPGQSFGPFKRDHYLIHFVIMGQGKLIINQKAYKLQARQAFLLTPDDVAFYQADQEAPWTYMWFGFHGLKAKALVETYIPQPVFDISSHTIDAIRPIINMSFEAKKNDLYNTGLLMQAFGAIEMDQLSHTKKSDSHVIDDIKEYIDNDFASIKSTHEISRAFDFNLDYISRRFKAQTGQSLKDYLMTTRINNARKLLDLTDMSIEDIGTSIGYQDPYYFSKIFKKKTGESPSGYRKRLQL
ncbi:AraC family transcriptional regulator [Acidaminobacter sp. JC074]|uniref:AraC family transcriptional regulator n=1 Tax=Acidaminobacter sp. JC074 TaxID=2530199 RepID=UPI001F0CF26A|nr:AraC family transcriptional regulator [Acidaminobacter sp. JC074]MCH4889654.1 AraC family transcriptional regulator [Acidaminobacter sp. JC074]